MEMIKLEMKYFIIKYFIIMLILISLKNYGYNKIKKKGLLVFLNIIDILYTFRNFVLFSLGIFVIFLYKTENKYRIFVILVCLLIILPMGIYKFYLITKNLIHLEKKDISKIIKLEVLDIIQILIHILLIIVDNL